MNTYLDLTKEQFQQLTQYPDGEPVKMLNLLKFKNKVGEGTGAEAYAVYMKATEPFFAKANAQVLFFGTPQLSLIGPQENEWDKVLIVEYATKQDFLNMVTAVGYPADLRRQALEDSRLILCS